MGLGPAKASIVDGDANHCRVSLSTSSSESDWISVAGSVAVDMPGSLAPSMSVKLGSEDSGGLEGEEELQFGVSPGRDCDEDDEDDGSWGDSLAAWAY